MQDKSIIDQLFSTPTPQLLYHYTSSTGLMGIIETSKIWTTKIHYMNDSSELQLAFKYIREEIEFQKGNSNRTRNIQDLDEMLNALDSIGTVNVSVASFTEEGDQLSQWRGYCKIGDGYSLGFDGKKLGGNVKEKFLCYLVPCVYEESKHKLMIQELVNYAIIRKAPPNPKPDDPLLQRMFFSTAALLIAPMIKAEGFREEKEWRLVCGPWEYDSAKFRRGNFSLIPYLEIGLDLKNTLKSVTIGPTPEKDLSERAVQGLLLKACRVQFSNQLPIKITHSKIPFRNI